MYRAITLPDWSISSPFNVTTRHLLDPWKKFFLWLQSFARTVLRQHRGYWQDFKKKPWAVASWLRFMIQVDVAQASRRVSKVTLSCPEGKSTFHERSEGTFFWAMIDQIMVLQLLVPKRKTLNRLLLFFLPWVVSITLATHRQKHYCY